MFSTWRFRVTYHALRGYMDDKDERKRRLAAARQARYRARKREEGMLFGVTVTNEWLELSKSPIAQKVLSLAKNPRFQQVLAEGKNLRPALTESELEALRLGQRVQKVLAEGGSKALGLKLAMKALDLL